MGCTVTDGGNQMLLALVHIVCLRNALFVMKWAWALATTGDADGSTSVTCWEVMLAEPKGSAHKLVARSFSPLKIIFLL